MKGDNPAVLWLMTLAFAGLVPIYIGDYQLIPAIWMVAYLLHAGVSHGMRPRPLTWVPELDNPVRLVALWILISVPISAPAYFTQVSPDEISSQVRSLIFAFSLLSVYVATRVLGIGESAIARAMHWLILPMLLFFGATSEYYLTSSDLYSARALFGQRIPFLMAIWSWVLVGLWLRARASLLALVGWALGSVSVLLSLTRGAYIVWAVGGLWIFWSQSRKKSLLLLAVILGGVAFSAPAILSHLEAGQLQTVQTRFAEYLFNRDLAQSDASTSVRLQIWSGLLGHVLDYPPALLSGFGQLGPSNFQVDYVGAIGYFGSSSSAHSQFLDSLIRGGLPLVGLEIWVTVRLFLLCASTLKEHSPSVALLGSLASLHLVFAFVDETLRWVPFAILFWFVAGAVANEVERIDRGNVVSKTRTFKQTPDRIAIAQSRGSSPASDES